MAEPFIFFFYSIGTEFLEGKSHSGCWETHRSKEKKKIPKLVESSINIVGLIFVHGEPPEKESFARELKDIFPLFLMFTLLYLHAVPIRVSLFENSG